jgi:hypothetical protein
MLWIIENSWKRGQRFRHPLERQSVARAPRYPLDGCSPAEPSSVSLGHISIARLKQNRRAGESNIPVLQKTKSVLTMGSIN